MLPGGILNFDLAQNVRTRLQRLYGQAATAWVEQLPTQVETVCRKHSLAIIRQIESYEAVVLETDAPNLGRLILKFGYPPRISASISAAESFSKHGGVRIVAADPVAGYLLMEKIEPGDTLLTLYRQGKDDRATEIAANSIANLRTAGAPPEGAFSRVEEHAKTFSRFHSTAALEGALTALLRRAESMFVELLGDGISPILLHGDLHHDNILVNSAGQAFVIDPKGRVGDPSYEIGAWMRNPMDLYDESNPAALLSRRFDIFCNILGDDRERLQNWSFVQVCLAALWLFEDEQKSWPKAAEFAEYLLRA